MYPAELGRKVLKLIEGADLVIFASTYYQRGISAGGRLGAFNLERRREIVP